MQLITTKKCIEINWISKGRLCHSSSIICIIRCYRQCLWNVISILLRMRQKLRTDWEIMSTEVERMGWIKIRGQEIQRNFDLRLNALAKVVTHKTREYIYGWYKHVLTRCYTICYYLGIPHVVYLMYLMFSYESRNVRDLFYWVADLCNIEADLSSEVDTGLLSTILTNCSHFEICGRENDTVTLRHVCCRLMFLCCLV